MGYSFVCVTPLAAAIVHFLFLFHIVNITIITVMSIAKTIKPAMAPPTAAGTDTLLAALDTILSTLLLVVKLVVVVISQAEGMLAVLSQAEIMVVTSTHN